MSTAKAYLRSIRQEQKEIRLLREKWYSLKMECYPPALRYDVDHVQTTPEDKLSKAIAEMTETEDAIIRHCEKLDRHKCDAMEMISLLSKPNHRMVLELYYLSIKKNRKLYTWSDIAKAMDYSVDNIWKIHGHALKEFEKIFKKFQNNA